MGRSRAAAIAGARRVIAERGVRKATMGDVAVRGGLAKATLYNHVRTKDELLLLVVDDAGDRVLAAAAGALGRGDLVTAFAVAAAELAGDELLVGLRRVEPTALLAVAAPGSGPGWDAARARVAAALHRAGRQVEDGVVDLVLRWLLSFVVAPGTPAARAAAARVLAGALPAAGVLPGAAARTTFATPAGSRPDA